MLLARLRLGTLRSAPTAPSLCRVPCASPPARPLLWAPCARWAAAGGMCPYMFRRSPPAPPARPPRIPVPLALPSAPRTRPVRAPGGGAAAGLQHPPPARPPERVAYSTAGSLACCGLFLKHTLPIPFPGLTPGTEEEKWGGPDEEKWGRVSARGERSPLARGWACLEIVTSWLGGRQIPVYVSQTAGILVPSLCQKLVLGSSSLYSRDVSLLYSQEAGDSLDYQSSPVYLLQLRVDVRKKSQYKAGREKS